jgi:hypothetical protein
MFRTVFPSIIRSSELYVQQQAYVKQILLPAASGKVAAGSSICLIYACCCMYSSELVHLVGLTIGILTYQSSLEAGN